MNSVAKYFESYFKDLSHLLSFVFVSFSGSRLVWILSIIDVFLFSSYVFTSGLYLNFSA